MPSRRVVRHVVAAALSAIASGAAYVGFLAWDTGYYYGTDGQLHGPYRAWQVIGLVIVLALIGFVGAALAESLPVAVAATLAVTIGFSISGATSIRNDGLWPVGSALVCVAMAGGMTVVAVLGSRSARHRHRPATTPPGTGRYRRSRDSQDGRIRSTLRILKAWQGRRRTRCVRRRAGFR